MLQNTIYSILKTAVVTYVYIPKLWVNAISDQTFFLSWLDLMKGVSKQQHSKSKVMMSGNTAVLPNTIYPMLKTAVVMYV